MSDCLCLSIAAAVFFFAPCLSSFGLLTEWPEKEELLLSEEVLNKVWLLRKVLSPMNTVEAMEFLLDKMSGTKSNKEFMNMMNS